jgi:ABC-type branched-subunit amino acid transport system substrate-binding protein
LRLKTPPLIAALAVLAGTVALAACGGGGGDDSGGSTEAEAKKQSFELRIGDLVPLTGDASAFGLPGVKSADLAAREIRRAIKRVGVEQRLIVDHEDDQTDPGPALGAARKTVEDGATCIAGPWTAGILMPLGDEISSKRKVVTISPSASAGQVTDLVDHGYVNRTVPPDKLQGSALAKLMADELGGARGKKVSIGARDVVYSRDIASTFSKGWRERGGMIGTKVLYRKKPDYGPEAGRLTRGNPDAYVILDFPETYHVLARSLRRRSAWSPAKTFVSDGLASQDLPGFGKRVTGGIRGVAPGVPSNERATTAFNKLYRSAPGAEPQTFTAQNFDAVMLCYLAAVAADSTEGSAMVAKLRAVSGPPGKKYTWLELPQAIRALRAGKDIDYQGASGPIDLDDAGDPTAGVYDTFRYTTGQRFIANKQFAEPGKLELFGKVSVREKPKPDTPPSKGAPPEGA